MPISLQAVPAEETARLVPILQDADEGLERIRATLADTRHTSYAALEGATLIGAATMRWLSYNIFVRKQRSERRTL